MRVWAASMLLLLKLPLVMLAAGRRAAQFGPMTGGDWAALVLASTVGILGMILLSQVPAGVLLFRHEMMPIEAPAGTDCPQQLAPCQALPSPHPRR